MAAYNPERALAEARREFGEHGGVGPSIERSATFTVLDPHTMPDLFQGLRSPDKGGYFLYSRHFNPTVDVLARYLAALEGTEFAVCTASGMGAISCALLQLAGQGDHLVASAAVYGGTHALLTELLPAFGVETTLVDPTDSDAFVAATGERTRAWFTEVVGNPTLAVADVGRLGRLAEARGIPLVVDNTFTPAVVSPARLGARIVVYSLTKFINGASDLIAGAICGPRAFVHQLMDLHTGRAMLLGPTMDPRVAYDVLQRLPHLPLRMREHGARALAMAERLAEIGAPVCYPGLPAHPQHRLFASLVNPGYGFGGVFTLDCGTRERADELLAALQHQERFGLIAVSLGYFDTLMSCSGSTTSSELSAEEQAEIGLSPGLVRISVGYTGDREDRVYQLERAVRAVGLA